MPRVTTEQRLAILELERQSGYELKRRAETRTEQWTGKAVDYGTGLVEDLVNTGALHSFMLGAWEGYKTEATAWVAKTGGTQGAALNAALVANPWVMPALTLYLHGIHKLSIELDPGPFLNRIMVWEVPRQLEQGLMKYWGMSRPGARKIVVATFPLIRATLEPWWRAQKEAALSEYKDCRSSWFEYNCKVKARNYLRRRVDWTALQQAMANVAVMSVRDEGEMGTTAAQLKASAVRVISGFRAAPGQWFRLFGPASRGETTWRQEGALRVNYSVFGYQSSDPTPNYLPPIGDGNPEVLIWAPAGNGSARCYWWRRGRWMYIGRYTNVRAPAGQTWVGLRRGVPGGTPEAGIPDVPGASMRGRPAAGHGDPGMAAESDVPFGPWFEGAATDEELGIKEDVPALDGDLAGAMPGAALLVAAYLATR